jgi:rhamnulokinase
VDGTVRYLRNVMGLWLLQESLRTWSAAGLRRSGVPARR